MTFSLSVVIRVLIAVLGSYILGICASFGMIPLSLWCFTDNVHDAIYIGLMSSYVFAFIAFIWCFTCKSNRDAMRDLSILSVTFLTLYYCFPVEIT